MSSVPWVRDGGRQTPADGSLQEFGDLGTWEMAMPLVFAPTEIEGNPVLGQWFLMLSHRSLRNSGKIYRAEFTNHLSMGHI